jgi:branched-chain amino acid transport system permease protein
MLSFGHAVYTGLGSCVAIHALRAMAAGSLGLPVSLLPLVGGLGGLLLALPLGYLSTRRAGTPFAMITLGVGELVAAAALMFPPLFGGEAGLSANRVLGRPVLGVSFGPQVEVYYLCAAYALASAALLYGFAQTPLGRLLNAVRDNPERAGFIGYDPHRVRHLATLVSGFFAGVAGGLAALHLEIVTAEVVGAARSASYLLFTFLGGAGHFLGPVLGAVLMVLSTVVLSAWTGAWLLYLGLFFLLTVMYAPGGMAGLLAGEWRLLRSGRALLPAYLRFLGAAALALGGVALLIELTYRLRLDAAPGDQLAFLGLSLGTGQPASWLGAAGAAVAGAALSRLTRRRLLRLLDARSDRPGGDVGQQQGRQGAAE